MLSFFGRILWSFGKSHFIKARVRCAVGWSFIEIAMGRGKEFTEQGVRRDECCYIASSLGQMTGHHRYLTYNVDSWSAFSNGVYSIIVHLHLNRFPHISRSAASQTAGYKLLTLTSFSGKISIVYMGITSQLRLSPAIDRISCCFSAVRSSQ